MKKYGSLPMRLLGLLTWLALSALHQAHAPDAVCTPTRYGLLTGRYGLGNVDFTKPIAGGPTACGFDTYFGVDLPNYPPYCFIENDRTLGVPKRCLCERAGPRRPPHRQVPARRGRSFHHRWGA